MSGAGKEKGLDVFAYFNLSYGDVLIGLLARTLNLSDCSWRGHTSTSTSLPRFILFYIQIII